jgi:hypothetical protein
MESNVSGHVRLVKRARGDQFYVKYRLRSGRQIQKRFGPVWKERGRPPEEAEEDLDVSRDVSRTARFEQPSGVTERT